VARITKRFIDALKAGDREAVYWDDDLPRFGVRVRPGGALTFICQYRTPGGRAGRTRKLGLGKVGVLTPDQARAAARVALGQADAGKDPAAEKRAKRADMLVAELVEKYLAEGPADKPGKKASSWLADASNLRRHVVPLLGRRRASSLTRRDTGQRHGRGDPGRSQERQAARPYQGARWCWHGMADNRCGGGNAGLGCRSRLDTDQPGRGRETQ
jgi:hypothetical protein